MKKKDTKTHSKSTDSTKQTYSASHCRLSSNKKKYRNGHMTQATTEESYMNDEVWHQRWSTFLGPWFRVHCGSWYPSKGHRQDCIPSGPECLELLQKGVFDAIARCDNKCVEVSVGRRRKWCGWTQALTFSCWSADHRTAFKYRLLVLPASSLSAYLSLLLSLTCLHTDH